MSKKRFKKFKITKIDIIANIFFILTFIAIYLFLTRDNHLFASNTDFKYQHYLIPEYFRTLFYETHDLFPDFALNLGGGQNIYYLSYYGLFNPIILLSYLFPHMNMLDYLITANCLIVLISTSLFYFYLRKNQYHEKTCFISAFLFLCSGPLIFHAKRHIMFMDYFPFLILGLYGIDQFIEKKQNLLLIISITLIILTSYYFSIPSLIVLFLYSIYKYLHQQNQQKNISLKKIWSFCLTIIPSFLLGIMITSFLTIPTFYTLLTGRTASHIPISIKDLLIPSTTSALLYSSYSIGLTPISLIALTYLCLKGKKETKYLAITCFLIITFPIFNYILNGTLYINAKSLIPFTPLILILVAIFLNPFLKKQTTKKQILLLLYLIIFPLTICLFTNNNDNLMTVEDVHNQNIKLTENWINEITKQDQSIYRINTNILKEQGINKITNINEYKSTLYSSTSNPNYTKLYNDIINNPKPNRNKFVIAPNDNILSQILLSEKYIITEDNQKLDFELLKEEKGLKLYKNNYILPLGYATSNLISTKEFQTLSYPTTILAMLNNIIIDNPKQENKLQTSLSPQQLNYKILKQQNVTITKENGKTYLTAYNDANITIKLTENMQNKILFLRFKVTNNNPNQDLAITINNTKNKLTCKSWKYYNNNTTFDYVFYNEDTLTISLKSGIYYLSNFETYLMDFNQIKNVNKKIDSLIINKAKTKGDNIIGTINITNNNSYFNLSIPYDKGFQIKIDNQITPYEKTGTNLISFPITKGHHNIHISYHAPYKNISLFISLTGLILLVITQYLQIKRKKIHYKSSSK